MTRRPRAWLGDFVLLAAVWGASFLFMRLAVVDFGPLATAFVRVLIAALFLLPIVAARGLLGELRAHAGAVLGIGVLNSGLPFACYSWALLTVTTGTASILNATVPMFGALVAWVWLGERLTRWRVAGLLIGFAGVALLAWDKVGLRQGSHDDMLRAALAIGACMLATLCYGISASAARRHLAGRTPLVTAAGSQIGAALALALPAAWVPPQSAPGLQAWLALLVVGVVCTALAYVLYFRLIESGGPSRALAVTYAVPVFAVAYGALFLAEPVTPWMLLCGAVIVLGTVLSTGLWVPRLPGVGARG